MASLALSSGERFLLIGDSITDCGRRDEFPPLGNGYAAILAGLVYAEARELDIEYLNRGIGCDTTVELEKRWDEDCLSLNPDWLTILIGINDCHQYLFDGCEENGPVPYAQRLERLLQRAVDATGCSVILLEPFYWTLPPGTDEHQRRVFGLLPEYIATVHQLAEQFQGRVVPVHEIGQQVLQSHPAEVLCPEPVHPNTTGHGLIASALFQALHEGS